MGVFKELNNKGYKHYYNSTIEKLDYMNNLNPELYSEIMRVVMWLNKKYHIWINVNHLPFNQKFAITITGKYQEGKEGVLLGYDFIHYSSPVSAYKEGIKFCLNNLI